MATSFSVRALLLAILVTSGLGCQRASTSPDIESRLVDLVDAFQNSSPDYSGKEKVLVSRARRDPEPFIQTYRSSPLPKARAGSIVVLGHLATEGSVDVALEGLGDRDLPVRRWAVNECDALLSRLPTGPLQLRVLEGLARALAEDPAGIEDIGLPLLARSGDQSCISILAAAVLKFGSVDVRGKAALEGLKRFPREVLKGTVEDVLERHERDARRIRALVDTQAPGTIESTIGLKEADRTGRHL